MCNVNAEPTLSCTVPCAQTVLRLACVGQNASFSKEQCEAASTVSRIVQTSGLSSE